MTTRVNTSSMTVDMSAVFADWNGNFPLPLPATSDVVEVDDFPASVGM